MTPKTPAAGLALAAAYAHESLDATLMTRAAAPIESHVLGLFERAVANVPAYRAFLAAQGVDPSGVKSLADYARVPVVTKDNYVRVYPLAERCRGGRLDAVETLALSSGSTGEATIWPRDLRDEVEVTRRFEHVFRHGFRAAERRTLAVVAFPLGTWVGGMYTAACGRLLAAKGYPLTVVTPGNNVPEILRIVALLGGMFEQVVLLGYPPFMKGVIDEGLARGIDWAALRPKLVLAGEVFTEEWRSWVAEQAGMADPVGDIAALYGTADAGVLGNETRLSVAIRRYLAAHPDAAEALFGERRLPTLVQVDPHARFFETLEMLETFETSGTNARGSGPGVDRTLLFSADGVAPLVRYHISDRGGVIPYDAMIRALVARGFDPSADPSVALAPVVPLPFVYVFGRSHHAVSFYGANVFPEMVSVGLAEAPLRASLTGKFVMQVEEDAGRDARFVVVVELARGVETSAALARDVGASIAQGLLRLNSEYAAYVPAPRQTPSIELRAAGDPDYFPPGIKHRWSRSRA